MGKRTNSLTPRLIKFIESQPLFFVATARKEGTINLSPKGMDSLRVIDANTVLWLNLTGSGNETAAHLLEDNRMTIMFNSFSKAPMILRLYGNAKAYHPRDSFYQENIDRFPKYVGSRQIINMSIELVQTSCGFGVPLMDYKSERGTLDDWSNQKGEFEIKNYWKEKNSISLDGHQTKIIE